MRHHPIIAVLTLLLWFAPGVQAASVMVRVIDRGQADGILIRTPNHQWVVIDAGTNAQQVEAMSGDWQVNEIALAIVTHRHHDHQGGMDDILSSIPTLRFIGVTEDCPNRQGDDLVRAQLSARHIPIEPLSDAITTHTVDGVRFTVFPLPARSDCPGHENLNSIVVRMDYGEFSMLFAGDAEEEELDFLVTNHAALLDVDVLKASHHGSDNGVTVPFLTAVSPDKVVISAGVNATYRHPMPEALSQYLTATNNKVYCTNRHGTLRIYGQLNGNSRLYKQFRNNKSCVYDGTHY